VEGILTELIELEFAGLGENAEYTGDVVNVKEELGDIMWYIAEVASALGYEPPATWEEFYGLASCHKPPCIFGLHAAGEMLDMLKKYKAYGKPWKNEVWGGLLAAVVAGVMETADEIWGFGMDDVLKTNIAKLRARYPEGYSDDRAINRDLEAERRVLES